MKNACFFTGHRRLPEMRIAQIDELLVREIIKLIDGGTINFLSGGACGFDLIAAKVVIRLKQQYPQIGLHLFLPYRGYEQKWRGADILALNTAFLNADSATYISEDYTPDCMKKRNERLVSEAQSGIAFKLTARSGTAQTMSLAKMYGRDVVNLADYI